MSASVIIGMLGIGVACSVAEKILGAFGKLDAAQFVNIAGLSAIAVTALSLTIKLIRVLGTLF